MDAKILRLTPDLAEELAYVAREETIVACEFMENSAPLQTSILSFFVRGVDFC